MARTETATTNPVRFVSEELDHLAMVHVLVW
jgi:hypothetical protein